MEILKNFGIQPTLLIAQIVNFVIILFLLSKFFYKPIIKMLDDRKKKIEESLKNADLITEKLKNTEEKSAQILKVAQKNAQELIAQAKVEGQKISEQASLEARKLIDEAVSQAQSQIEIQKTQMQKQLEKETLNLVIEVTKKVLGRTLEKGEKTQITKNAIAQLQRKIS